MPKQTSARHVSRPPTMDEISLALSRLAPVPGLRADDDDPLAVLYDACAELQTLRAMREKLMQQVNEWKIQLQRK